MDVEIKEKVRPPLLTKSREVELSTIISGQESPERDMAICEMVESNTGLVFSLTKKYRTMPDYDDVLADAHLGLIKAVLGFKPELGAFSTYAVWKIKTEVRDGMGKRIGSPVYAPRTAVNLAYKLLNAVESNNGMTSKEVVSAKLASMTFMDAIPLYTDEGLSVDLADDRSSDGQDGIADRDLMELVLKASRDLGLTDDELSLVSGISDDLSEGQNMSGKLAAKRKCSPQNMRMLKLKLVWKIKRKILEYVGKEEYLSIVLSGGLPDRSWR